MNPEQAPPTDRAAWTVVGATLTVFILVMITITATIGWAWTSSDAAPQWVQALGTLAALFLTGGLAWWEARQRRREARVASTNALHARVAVLAAAVGELEYFLRAVLQHQANATPLHRLAQRLEWVLQQAAKIPLNDMPTRAAVSALATFNQRAANVISQAEQGRLNVSNVVDTYVLNSSLHWMKVSLEGLEEEVKKLARE